MEKLEVGTQLFTVAMGYIPNLKTAKKLVRLLQSIEGFVAISPNIPSHDKDSLPKTLVYFDSLNHAKGGRNRLRHEGVQCGTNICFAEVDESGSTLIKGVAE